MTGQLVAPGGRAIEYLRLSVTDRCNLRCRYCMPPEGVPDIGHPEVLRNEEILRLVRVMAGLGIKKVRVTGGEPLVRRGIVEMMEDLGRVQGLEDLVMTTNGLLLDTYAADLGRAGLKRVNLSLDTVRPERYREMTRGGDIARFWRGLRAAEAAGLDPIKINCVVMRGVNDDEVIALAGLALEHPWEIRFIEYMPVGCGADDSGTWRRHFVSWEEVRDVITGRWDLLELPHRPGSTARLYRMDGMAGRIGFIPSVSGHLCAECNRLRLTADGNLHLCLLQGGSADLRKPLREGARDRELASVIRSAVLDKPLHHGLDPAGNLAGSQDRPMSKLGG